MQHFGHAHCGYSENLTTSNSSTKKNKNECSICTYFYTFVRIRNVLIYLWLIQNVFSVSSCLSNLCAASTNLSTVRYHQLAHSRVRGELKLQTNRNERFPIAHSVDMIECLEQMCGALQSPNMLRNCWFFFCLISHIHPWRDTVRSGFNSTVEEENRKYRTLGRKGKKDDTNNQYLDDKNK